MSPSRIPLPFRVVAIGEFAPRTLEGDTAPPSGPFTVKPATLDDVMARLAGRVPLAIDSPGRGRIGVEADFTSIAGLRPDRAAKGLKHLEVYASVRDALIALRDGKMSTEDTRAALEALQHPVAGELAKGLAAGEPGLDPPTQPLIEPEPPTEPADGGSLGGGLFDMIDTGGSPVTPTGLDPHREAEHEVRRALSAITAGARVRSGAEREAAEASISAVNSLWSDELRAVFHHPEFRRLEGLWRGLRLLLAHGDFSEDDLRVDVLSAPRDEAGAVLKKLADELEDAGSEHGVGLVIADYDWDLTGSSWTDLRALADGAEELPAPVVTGVGAAFLNLRSLDEAARIEDWGAHFQADTFMKFRGLRDAEVSRWLFLVANRLPLRTPYGAGQDVKDTGFREFPREPEPLWGNAAWGVGAVALESFTRTGWATDLLAPGRGGRVGDLPVRPVTDPAGRTWHVPAEAPYREQIRRDLNTHGLMAWSVEDQSDAMLLAAAPAVHMGGASKDEARDTLPYGVFTTRAAQMIRFVSETIENVSSAEEARLQMAAGMVALLGGPGEGLTAVQAGNDPNRSGRMAVTVTMDARAVPGSAPPLDLTIWLK
jgi:type VI secretion system protein ImpC